MSLFKYLKMVAVLKRFQCFFPLTTRPRFFIKERMSEIWFKSIKRLVAIAVPINANFVSLSLSKMTPLTHSKTRDIKSIIVINMTNLIKTEHDYCDEHIDCAVYHPPPLLPALRRPNRAENTSSLSRKPRILSTQ